MFDNGRVWAPDHKHCLLNQHIALKVRERKQQQHTQTRKCTHMDTNIYIYPPAAVSEAKVVNRCDIKLLITLVLAAKVRWCNTQGIKLCWDCPIYVIGWGCFVPKKLSMPLCCDRVFHLSSSLHFHLPLSLSQFLHHANGRHVYSTMHILVFH